MFPIERSKKLDKFAPRDGRIEPSSSAGSSLVEFRAGRMNMVGKMVYPDLRKGLVYLSRSEDGLMHFCWKDRVTGEVEDDLIVSADAFDYKRVQQCKTGRVYVFKFKTSPRRMFYWKQEPEIDKDEEHCRRINELIKNHSSMLPVVDDLPMDRCFSNGVLMRSIESQMLLDDYAVTPAVISQTVLPSAMTLGLSNDRLSVVSILKPVREEEPITSPTAITINPGIWIAPEDQERVGRQSTASDEPEDLSRSAKRRRRRQMARARKAKLLISVSPTVAENVERSNLDDTISVIDSSPTICPTSFPVSRRTRRKRKKVDKAFPPASAQSSLDERSSTNISSCSTE